MLKDSPLSRGATAACVSLCLGRFKALLGLLRRCQALGKSTFRSKWAAGILPFLFQAPKYDTGRVEGSEDSWVLHC